MPEGWYHATHNLDSSIGVAGQNLSRGASTPLMQAWTKVNEANNGNNPQLAIDALTAVQDATPEHAGVCIARADKLFDIGKQKEAIEDAQTSVNQTPGHSDSHTRLGQFKLVVALGQLLGGQQPPSQAKDAIVASFERAFELNPFDVDAADCLCALCFAS